MNFLSNVGCLTGRRGWEESGTNLLCPRGERQISPTSRSCASRVDKRFHLWEPRELTKYFALDSVMWGVEIFLKSMLNPSVFCLTNYHCNTNSLLVILSNKPEPAISVSPSFVCLLLYLHITLY